MIRPALKLAAVALIGLPLMVNAVRYSNEIGAAEARRGSAATPAPGTFDLASYDLRGVDLASRQIARGLKKKTTRVRHRDQSFQGLRDVIRDSNDPELKQFLPAIDRLELAMRQHDVDEVSYVDGFIEDFAPLALCLERETGLPASVMLAQIIVESGWGASNVTILKNNVLGIGNCDEPGEFTADVDFLDVERGIRVQCMADTSAYRFETVGESILYYAYLLLKNEKNEIHYGKLREFIQDHRAMQFDDPAAYRDRVIELMAQGYHSNPDWYVGYLKQIVERVDDSDILPEVESRLYHVADSSL